MPRVPLLLDNAYLLQGAVDVPGPAGIKFFVEQRIPEPGYMPDFVPKSDSEGE